MVLKTDKIKIFAKDIILFGLYIINLGGVSEYQKIFLINQLKY